MLCLDGNITISFNESHRLQSVKIRKLDLTTHDHYCDLLASPCDGDSSSKLTDRGAIPVNIDPEALLLCDIPLSFNNNPRFTYFNFYGKRITFHIKDLKKVPFFKQTVE